MPVAMFFKVHRRIFVILLHGDRPASFPDNKGRHEAQLFLKHVGVFQKTKSAEPVLIDRLARFTGLHVGIVRIVGRMVGSVRMGYEEHLVEQILFAFLPDAVDQEDDGLGIHHLHTGEPSCIVNDVGEFYPVVRKSFDSDLPVRFGPFLSYFWLVEYLDVRWHTNFT